MLHVPSVVAALAIRNSYAPSFNISEPIIVPGRGFDKCPLLLSMSYTRVQVFESPKGK